MAPLLDVLFAHDTRLVAVGARAAARALHRAGARRRHARRRARGHGASTRERHVRAGADLIVAQGTEAGGHTGEIATMVLVPEVVDAVAPVPVLAAGGIAHRPPARRRHGPRRRRRVVRLGVAHDRGSRDAARR